MIKSKYFESSGETKRVTSRMMEYLGHVIDTPIDEGTNNLGGKVADEVIGKKMKVTRSRIANYRDNFAEKYTKEEILELCEEIMKEAA
jgi:hypothetical protein|tara:strand:- start:17 stop:280 length:264 start_codon:yes stop_codon:yes gene_type:complete